MSIDIMGLFKRQTFTERPPERQILTVPIHAQVDHVEAQPVLEKAAEQIVGSGRVWRWDGTAKLCGSFGRSLSFQPTDLFPYLP